MNFMADQEKSMIALHGEPERLVTVQQVTPPELDTVRSSMKNGRAHDLTLYIRKDGGFIFIAKPFYPEGLFRAPSGGAKPGEDFDKAAGREALEETGVEIRLDRYLLRIDVRFQTDDDYIDWTSHIFLADYIGGEIRPRDTVEIKEARLIYPEQIPGIIDLMTRSGWGGMLYRAYLTRECYKRM